MDSDRGSVTDFSGDYRVAATTELGDRRPRRKIAVGILFSLVFVLALTAIGLSYAAIRKSNAATADRVERRNAQIISACEGANLSRQHTYESQLAFAVFVVANRDAGQPPPKLIVDYVRYVSQAYDPVSCVLGDPNFGKDTTEPDPLPIDFDQFTKQILGG